MGGGTVNIVRPSTGHISEVKTYIYAPGRRGVFGSVHARKEQKKQIPEYVEP
jgi:hypothetical protein